MKLVLHLTRDDVQQLLEAVRSRAREAERANSADAERLDVLAERILQQIQGVVG